MPPLAITSTVVPRFSNSVPSLKSGMSIWRSLAGIMLNVPVTMLMGDCCDPVLHAPFSAARACQLRGPYFMSATPSTFLGSSLKRTHDFTRISKCVDLDGPIFGSRREECTVGARGKGLARRRQEEHGLEERDTHVDDVWA